MSSEAQIFSSLFINAQGNAAPLVYQSNPTKFNVDMSSPQAATPGGLLVTVKGIYISLAAITGIGGQPGLASFAHLGSDPLNYITVGITNGADFFPFMELGPGERWNIKLSRNLLQQYAGSATAVGLPQVGLYAEAATGSVQADFAVFPK